MKCPNCGVEVNEKWTFCPRCGVRLKKNFFESIFSRFRKEMQDEMKGFERQFEVFDLSPWFKKPTHKGFSIKIVSATGRQPKVSVKTFGDIDKRKVEEQICTQLGIKERPREGPIKIGAEELARQKPAEIPKTTEEPKTEVKRTDSKVVVDMHIPAVASKEDIEIKELESSVEVKARAGEKTYFKILTKPQNYKLAAKSFAKGILHLEFA